MLFARLLNTLCSSSSPIHTVRSFSEVIDHTRKSLTCQMSKMTLLPNGYYAEKELQDSQYDCGNEFSRD
jgi:hypothetical protein